MKAIEPVDSFSTPAKAVLQNLVDGLIKKQLAIAVRNNSFIINNVPPKLSISGYENVVASVINSLLHSVIINARETCISISAKELYGKTVVVSVKDSNSYNTYAVACSLQDVVLQAEMIGGNIDITSQRQKITTIAFRFPIVQEAGTHPGI